MIYIEPMNDYLGGVGCPSNFRQCVKIAKKKKILIIITTNKPVNNRKVYQYLQYTMYIFMYDSNIYDHTQKNSIFAAYML